MSPWWLRPPAEEEPASKKKPQKPATGTKEKKPAEEQNRKPAAKPSRPERSKGGSRRRSSSGKGRPKPTGPPRIAIFYDVEGSGEDLDLEVMLQRVAERGEIIARRAYGDWQRFSDLKDAVATTGFEIVDLPRTLKGKSSADINLAIDAVELCFSKEPCEIYVVVSTDGAFHPLVAKLRESKALVIGIGARDAVSPDLADNCDEYLYLDELAKPEPPIPAMVEIDEAKQPVFTRLVETFKNLEQQNEGVIWGSMLKQEMRRQDPEFDPTKLGYGSFSDFLEDAERHEIIQLERDDRSGVYYVAGIAGQ